MNKKIKALMFAMIFTLSALFPVNVQADENHLITLSDRYAEENSTATITVSVEPELVTAAFSVSLYFDPSKLEFVDAAMSQKAGNFYFGDTYEDCATIIWSDSQNRTFESELFTVTFKTKGGITGDTVPIDVGYAVSGTTNGNEKELDAKGCQIIVASEYKWGDANCDGEVSVSDAVMINLFNINAKKHPLSEIAFLNSDTDSNGVVNLKDSDNVINHITRP